MRGRPKEFDQEEALERAMAVFWECGYGAAGMAELTAEMGIGRQSLYDTFGDKRRLFLAALRRYAQMRVAMFREVLEAPGRASDNLRGFFDLWRQEMASKTGCCGCLLINSSTELGGSDPEIEQLLNHTLKQIRGMVRDLLIRIQSEGDLLAPGSPGALALMVWATGNGLVAASRLDLDPEQVDEMLTTLENLLVGQRPN